MTRPTTFAGALLALCALGSCEKIELANETEPDKEQTQEETTHEHTTDATPESVAHPMRLGEGTKEAPYTVTQLIDDLPLYDTVYVVGYAVGEMPNTTQPPCFEPPFTEKSHVLLAASRDCQKRAKCLPVELSNASTQGKLSLAFHPEQHHECYLVKGVVNTYKDLWGLRNVREGYCLTGFDIPYTDPTVWEETGINYR